MRLSRRTLLKSAAFSLLASAARASEAGPGAKPKGEATVHKRRIPRSGEEVPCIGLGTWQTFDVGAGARARAAQKEVLRLFYERGGRIVDSSPMYGRAEEVVGDLAAELDVVEPLFLATKVWTRGAAQGRAQIESSFSKMRTPRMDLFQVHNLLDWRTHLPVLKAMKAEGRVRYVGVTHYQLSAFDELEQILRTEDVDFVQLPYSVGVREAEARLLPAAKDTGTAVLVMRPFEEGALFRSVKGKPLPPFAAEVGAKSWAQLFLKFILSHDAVTAPIPATSKPDHLVDNLGAGDGRVLDAAQRKALIAAVGG